MTSIDDCAGNIWQALMEANRVVLFSLESWRSITFYKESFWEFSYIEGKQGFITQLSLWDLVLDNFCIGFFLSKEPLYSVLSIVIMEMLVMSYKVFVFFLSSVILHDDVVHYTSLFLMELNYHIQQYQSLKSQNWCWLC